jgi:large subunit ribosomal protein L28
MDCDQAPQVISMAKCCELTGKQANNAYAVSHSHRRTKKVQEANLQVKRVWWATGKRWVKLRLSTKALKTLERKGLDAMAKEAGIDLRKH